MYSVSLACHLQQFKLWFEWIFFIFFNFFFFSHTQSKQKESNEQFKIRNNISVFAVKYILDFFFFDQQFSNVMLNLDIELISDLVDLIYFSVARSNSQFRNTLILSLLFFVTFFNFVFYFDFLHYLLHYFYFDLLLFVLSK